MSETKSSATSAQSSARALRGKTLTVGVKPHIKAEQLHKALDEMLRFGGCLACGLIGFDIRFIGVNPAMDQFRGIEQAEGIQYADIR